MPKRPKVRYGVTQWSELGRLPASPREAGQGLLFLVSPLDGGDERPPHCSSQYVLKELKPLSDTEAFSRKLERFRREIEITRLLARDGFPVVPVVDSSFPEDGKGAFYVMPLYPKGSFRRLLENGVFTEDLSRGMTEIRQKPAIGSG